MNEESGFYNDAGLSRIANILQIGSFLMNAEQLQNEDIMKALDYQNLNYLDFIMDNQKIILEKLENIEKRLDKLENMWYNKYIDTNEIKITYADKIPSFHFVYKLRYLVSISFAYWWFGGYGAIK